MLCQFLAYSKVIQFYICAYLLVSHSIVSSSLQHHGLQPARLLCPRDFAGKNTGVGCHFLLQGIFPIQGSNPHFLHWQVDSLPLSHLGSPWPWRVQGYSSSMVSSGTPGPSFLFQLLEHGFVGRDGCQSSGCRICCSSFKVSGICFSTSSNSQPPVECPAIQPNSDTVYPEIAVIQWLSHVRLCATPWTAAHQAPPSMGFSRQEYWSGVPLPSPKKKLNKQGDNIQP